MKTCIVTNSSTELGLLLVRKLCAMGYYVYALCPSDSTTISLLKLTNPELTDCYSVIDCSIENLVDQLTCPVDNIIALDDVSIENISQFISQAKVVNSWTNVIMSSKQSETTAFSSLQKELFLKVHSFSTYKAKTLEEDSESFAERLLDLTLRSKFRVEYVTQPVDLLKLFIYYFLPKKLLLFLNSI
ncbi:hypothetical protein DAMA08_036120 [Martiniozyma asiatica (nom. inval.)]|nr:hypothetical protein DAMA08_036120 [Martiniozyma asiatica]